MNTYIVILKLVSQEDLYTNLVIFLKSGSSWARPMPNTWFVKTTNSAADIRDGVKSRIGTQDAVLVINVTKGWGTSNISKAVTDWMKTHL